jgi:hypothetical protein
MSGKVWTFVPSLVRTRESSLIKTMSRSTGCAAILISGFLLLASASCRADEELVTTAVTPSSDVVPYVLNTAAHTPPRYVLILFPGGMGLVDPHLEDGKLVYSAGSNFLLRARPFLVDEEFATVATNATSLWSAYRRCSTICTGASPRRASM